MNHVDFDVDPIQALLDMLAGWGEFVAERMDNPDDQSYTQCYLDAIFDLRQKVAEQVWTDEPTLTPKEFVEQHVLPLFTERAV